MGVLITDQNEQWLHNKYPLLTIKSGKISGVIEFKAMYNDQTGQFMVLENNTPNIVGKNVLTGRFNIRIEDRVDKSLSRLPAVYIDDVGLTPYQHLNQTDESACLCSPIEEDDIVNEFHLPQFLEKLVIPFLYGQIFYSINQHWPWGEYSHGATGLLESYLKIADSTKTELCLQKLSKDKIWPRIKSVLEQKTYIKGHTLCFCQKMDQMRRCHPNALRGIQQLWTDIKNKKINIPK
jgi:hypothetical protein